MHVRFIDYIYRRMLIFVSEKTISVENPIDNFLIIKRSVICDYVFNLFSNNYMNENICLKVHI